MGVTRRDQDNQDMSGREGEWRNKTKYIRICPSPGYNTSIMFFLSYLGDTRVLSQTLDGIYILFDNNKVQFI